MNKYTSGDLVRCLAAFATTAGVAIDPTAVKFAYRNPAGITTVLTYPTDAALVKDSVGNYHVDVNINAAGVWRYRFYSTGTGQAADEGEFSATSNF